MQYTTRPADDPTRAHVNYECPCGCTAGLMYNRASGSEHLGECCCGRLLWLGDDAEARVVDKFQEGVGYDIEIDTVTLPWGDEVKAVLANPARMDGLNETAPGHDHDHDHEGHPHSHEHGHEDEGHENDVATPHTHDHDDDGHIHIERQRVRDFVCGMMIDPETAAATSEYKGETYYFCAQGCKQQFDADPTRFVKQPGLIGRIFGRS